MEALDVRPGSIEPEKVIDNKLVERLQKERCSAKRCAVQCFALLVTDRLFDDLDHELRVLWSEVEIRSFQICEESFNSLFQFLARNLTSAPDRFAVFKDDRPVLAVNLFQWMRVRQQVRLVSLRQERYCRLSFASLTVSSPIPSSMKARSCSDRSMQA